MGGYEEKGGKKLYRVVGGNQEEKRALHTHNRGGIKSIKNWETERKKIKDTRTTPAGPKVNRKGKCIYIISYFHSFFNKTWSTVAKNSVHDLDRTKTTFLINAY